MLAALRIVDETPTGEPIHAYTLELASERITVRELIERRVRTEAVRHNRRVPANAFRGFVQPELRAAGRIDADEQVKVALQAFETNGYFMLFDDRQVESLDEEIVLTKTSTATFVKLMPLVGG